LYVKWGSGVELWFEYSVLELIELIEVPGVPPLLWKDLDDDVDLDYKRGLKIHILYM
jgi:hypothetical protein